MEQSNIGTPRPQPTFGAQNTAEKSAVQPDAGEVQVHAGAPVDESEYTVSVDEIRARLFELGIEKSKDTIQRYCREGELDAIKLGMFRRYFATPTSVDRLVEKLEGDAGAGDGTQVHAGERTSMQVHAAPSSEETSETATKNNDPHAGASSRTQVHAGASEDVEFLKDQIRVKDEQLRVKDELLVNMLERDRETNHLIRDLHQLLTKSLALQAGRDERIHDAKEGVENNGGEGAPG